MKIPKLRFLFPICVGIIALMIFVAKSAPANYAAGVFLNFAFGAETEKMMTEEASRIIFKELNIGEDDQKSFVISSDFVVSNGDTKVTVCIRQKQSATIPSAYYRVSGCETYRVLATDPEPGELTDANSNASYKLVETIQKKIH